MGINKVKKQAIKEATAKPLTDEEKLLLKQAKVQVRVEAFQKEYADLRVKHGLDFYAILMSDQAGIYPRITIMNTPKNPSAPAGHPDTQPTQVGSELE